MIEVRLTVSSDGKNGFIDKHVALWLGFVGVKDRQLLEPVRNGENALVHWGVLFT